MTKIAILASYNGSGFDTLYQAGLKQELDIEITLLISNNSNSVALQNAQKYVTDYFPKEAKKFGVAQTTRVFDATITEEASRGVNSAHYPHNAKGKPGAFVYTEVQINIPFEEAPWRKRNPILLKQKGLLYKTWLSG